MGQHFIFFKIKVTGKESTKYAACCHPDHFGVTTTHIALSILVVYVLNIVRYSAKDYSTRHYSNAAMLVTTIGYRSYIVRFELIALPTHCVEI